MARRAGLGRTALDNYFGRESEPSRPILVALAAAADVSLDWLLAGRGEKRASDAPEGYLWVRCYDLSESGANVHGIVGEARDRHLVRLDELPIEDLEGERGPGGMRWTGRDLVAFRGAPEIAFPPEIAPGSTVVIYASHWPKAVQKPVGGEGKLQESVIYLVADGTSLKLRKLRPARKTEHALEIIAPDRKVERTAFGLSLDEFWLLGPIIWRSGPPGEKVKL